MTEITICGIQTADPKKTTGPYQDLQENIPEEEIQINKVTLFRNVLLYTLGVFFSFLGALSCPANSKRNEKAPEQTLST